ncbi:Rrf2 family transcriptional regulator [Paracoccus aurantiacus]|uniref:Rrf2 family transcriptional regulator n=1 Tax=Paracoccus aurantiacus TaxID=2599412 RepID=A0A5C6RRY3_9RHOB|nr:Rrf2 family transcriptional regulator [Paracoccus aurantiacus]TXB65023.1 Rrf2 family transcriptional regulator [Paracoccus aurantiacus]
MRLTAYTNYALRTLQLAALKEPDLVRIEEVVKIHGLKKPNIVKAVHELGREGYLVTKRGRGGGFQLARPATEIRVGDVVRLTEGDLDIVECFNPDTNTCPLIGVCRLSRAFQEATRAFMAVLDDLTIADIAANKGALMGRIDDALALPQDAPR